MVFLYNIANVPGGEILSADNTEIKGINGLQSNKRFSSTSKLKQLTQENRLFLISLGFKIKNH